MKKSTALVVLVLAVSGCGGADTSPFPGKGVAPTNTTQTAKGTAELAIQAINSKDAAGLGTLFCTPLEIESFNDLFPDATQVHAELDGDLTGDATSAKANIDIATDGNHRTVKWRLNKYGDTWCIRSPNDTSTADPKSAEAIVDRFRDAINQRDLSQLRKTICAEKVAEDPKILPNFDDLPSQATIKATTRDVAEHGDNASFSGELTISLNGAKTGSQTIQIAGALVRVDSRWCINQIENR